MIRRTTHGIATLLFGLFLSSGGVAGQEVISSGFRIRPSEVAVPSDVRIGEYERTIRPFENWTLICDEDLQKRQRICNVTQIIENQAGQMVFSWSLAATNEGRPYMIIRTAPIANTEGLISFIFEGRSEPVQIEFDGCNQTVCLGMLPVGPITREQIARNAAPTISYPTIDGKTISVTAPLKGLSEAVEAIN
ncbi:invasion associated locus B family protein [Falsirhodobacter deserti]|uniref:invasion associated locus B family protein n=1 Tax=Falsirhodobacter deserti TaxID=1365611 RepID=UPI0019D47414|nr:invasion associated locus B family protein [Falsirhodobacter deserti]